MRYAIVVSSKTGNTQKLGDTAAEFLSGRQILYHGTPGDEALKADVILVGFWTDKGTCDEDTSAFLGKLAHKQVFLFGTAGFGGSPEYFEQILQRVSKNLPASCTLTGSYMCQGKMGRAVRDRYEMLLRENPDDKKYEALIANFDSALSHPDEEDLQRFSESLERALRRVNSFH